MKFLIRWWQSLG